jgi:hypothetical protein
VKHFSSMSIALACASILGCGAKTDVRGPFDDVTFPDAGPPRGGRYGFAGCTPGSFVTVACGARGLGSCSGDPVLHVCDAARSTPERCGRPVPELGFNDDAEGLCSAIEVLCPASGQLSIRARRFSTEDDPVDCRWDTRETR